jgi:hypothetical protein
MAEALEETPFVLLASGVAGPRAAALLGVPAMGSPGIAHDRAR